jgi:hypothetical protein
MGAFLQGREGTDNFYTLPAAMRTAFRTFIIVLMSLFRYAGTGLP